MRFPGTQAPSWHARGMLVRGMRVLDPRVLGMRVLGMRVLGVPVSGVPILGRRVPGGPPGARTQAARRRPAGPDRCRLAAGGGGGLTPRGRGIPRSRRGHAPGHGDAGTAAARSAAQRRSGGREFTLAGARPQAAASRRAGRVRRPAARRNRRQGPGPARSPRGRARGRRPGAGEWVAGRRARGRSVGLPPLRRQAHRDGHRSVEQRRERRHRRLLHDGTGGQAARRQHGSGRWAAAGDPPGRRARHRGHPRRSTRLSPTPPRARSDSLRATRS